MNKESENIDISHRLVISRVVSEDMIELNIVDLVVGLSLEPLKDDLVLFLAYLELHGIEDGSEACVGDKAALALVLVLEEGLDQKALIADEPSEALKTRVEDFFLTGVELVLGVED